MASPTASATPTVATFWHYWFNKGSAFIPYNYGYSQRTGVFYFDSDGHLKDFDYND